MNEELLNLINCWLSHASIEDAQHRTIDANLLKNYIVEARNLLMNPNTPSYDIGDANLPLLLMMRSKQ